MISPQKRRRNAVKWRRFLESAQEIAKQPGSIHLYDELKQQYVVPVGGYPEAKSQNGSWGLPNSFYMKLK